MRFALGPRGWSLSRAVQTSAACHVGCGGDRQVEQGGSKLNVIYLSVSNSWIT